MALLRGHVFILALNISISLGALEKDGAAFISGGNL
jgi:hypothetical protein